MRKFDVRYLLLCGIIVVAVISSMRGGVSGAGVRVDNGTSLCVNCNSSSWKVTNNNASAIFVPNNTSAEFTAFQTRAPAIGVTIGSCSGCNGVMNMTVTHTAGTVAPVTKTVVYNITETDIAGTGTKCWITQNLGADHEATAVNDATEASAGWYWQYNLKQGYKHDGTTRTPSGWPAAVVSHVDWSVANDPCTLLLGVGWRIPTYTEWYNADLTGAWSSGAHVYASVLKLHEAGGILDSGSLSYRGSMGLYWSSSDSDVDPWSLKFGSDSFLLKFNFWGLDGRSIRCLRDPWVCGNVLLVSHSSSGGVAPVNKTVNYGTVLTSLSGASKCWITQNLGADKQALSALDTSEQARGWFWQFNQKQGYKHDGATRTPSIAWPAAAGAGDWLAANDPCTLLLGAGWRIPTRAEWTNADSAGGWGGYAQVFASVLVIHTAGEIYSGALYYAAGGYGYYWSSTDWPGSGAWYLDITAGACAPGLTNRANGLSIRCLKD